LDEKPPIIEPMSNARETIMGRVRSALAPLPKRAAYPTFGDHVATMPGLATARATVDVFKERILLVNGLALSSAVELADWLKAQGHTRGYCDPELWPRLANAFDSEMRVETIFDRTRVDDYQFGITLAAGAIAETGTIMLKDASTSSRLAALSPWVHVAVLPTSQIYRDVADAVATLGADPNIVWCTGPSKTADVEGILIQGVHGPGVQIALLTA
jgi:L-lactate dehydrogenase complex protein LldG